MTKYPKNHSDIQYYVPGRKRRVAGSTHAISNFLAIVHEENPSATIAQLREIITDKTRYIPVPEAVAVLDAHIAAGYGGCVPDWRYGSMKRSGRER